jgi:hypothetical protein
MIREHVLGQSVVAPLLDDDQGRNDAGGGGGPPVALGVLACRGWTLRSLGRLVPGRRVARDLDDVAHLRTWPPAVQHRPAGDHRYQAVVKIS